MQGADPGYRQYHEDRLGPVGNRGQCVERKRRQALDLSDLLLGHLARAKWSAHQDTPHRPGGVASLRRSFAHKSRIITSGAEGVATARC